MSIHDHGRDEGPRRAALGLLLQGNAAYRAGSFADTAASGHLAGLLAGQHPVAAVLCCADSRVPPELIFDRGLGEIFVVRNAGAVIDEVVLGSLEYAVEHLGVELIVVLGHEKCGAVTAAVAGAGHSHIAAVVAAIHPAVEASAGLPGDPVANAIDAHIRATVARLAAEPAFAGRVEVTGLRYSLADGTLARVAG